MRMTSLLHRLIGRSVGSLALVLTASLALTANPAFAQRYGGGDVSAGKWSKSEIPKGWCVYNTRHYQIQSQVGKEKAERLGRHMEAMVKLYKKTFPPGKGGFIAKPCKLFKDRDAYIGYGGSPGSAGYYTWGANRELVTYDSGRWQDEKKSDGPTTGGKRSMKDIRKDLMKRGSMDILGVMSHEGWHQYFHWYVVSQVNLPSWINEGMGDYFYTAVPPYGEDGKMIGKVELGRLNDARLPTIRVAVKNDQHVPFEEIIRYSQADYYARPGLCYAQGWAMSFFLMQHSKKKIRKIIPKFIKLVKDDGNVDNCTDKAFRGFDLAKLEEEWKAWVLKAKLPEENRLEKELAEAMAREIEEAVKEADAEAEEEEGEESSDGDDSSDGEDSSDGDGSSSSSD